MYKMLIDSTVVVDENSPPDSMYRKVQAKGVVRIPPARLGEDIDSVIEDVAQKTYEGCFCVVYEKKTESESNKANAAEDDEKKLSAVLIDLYVMNVKHEGKGRIVHGDGSVYQDVQFDKITCCLKIGSSVLGKVVEVTNYGAFVNIGPMDGLLHIQELMSDAFDVDLGNQMMVGRATKRTLKKDDIVRARISQLSIKKGQLRVGLTMRPTGLGKLQWIDEDNEEAEGEA